MLTQRRHLMRRALLTVVATALTISTMNSVASASTERTDAAASEADVATADLAAGVTSATKAQIEKEVAGVLTHNPGSRRLNATSVLLKPGVVLTVPGPTAPGAKISVSDANGAPVMLAASVSDCSLQDLCVWTDPRRTGYRMSFYWCGDEEMSDYYWGSRGQYTFQDNISSIYDHQTGSPVSYFYDYDIHGGTILVGTMTPGNWLDNLALDRARDGRTWDNRIDRIHVC